MKLRLIEKGFQKFNGEFGGLIFKDGESVRKVTPVEAMRISNLVRTETLEGVNPSSSQQVLDSRTTVMPVMKALERGVEATTVKPEKPEMPAFSRESLEQIADKKGIAGLREIGDQFGIRGKSIEALIQTILNHQKGNVRLSDEEKTDAAQPLAENKA